MGSRGKKKVVWTRGVDEGEVWRKGRGRGVGGERTVVRSGVAFIRATLCVLWWREVSSFPGEFDIPL